MGLGWATLLGREHDSTPQSGVEAARMSKRASADCIIYFVLVVLVLVSHADVQKMFMPTTTEDQLACTRCRVTWW